MNLGTQFLRPLALYVGHCLPVISLVCLASCATAENQALPPTIEFEPFRAADGFIDYAAALNSHVSAGLKPEQNAVVAIAREINTDSYDPAYLARFWSLIGAEPPEHKGTWLEWRDYLSALGIEDEEGLKRCTPVIVEGAAGIPIWSVEDYPEMAEWLNQAGPSMDRIAEALQGNRALVPLVGAPGQPIHALRLPHLSIARQLARSYQYRLGLALHEGRLDDAIQDLASIRRMGFLLGQDPLALGQLVSISIYRMSHACIESILSDDKLGPKQLAAIAECVDQTIYERGGMRRAYALGERAHALSCFDFLMRSDDWRALHFGGELLTEQGAEELLPRLHRAFNHPGFDAGLARERIESNVHDFWEIASAECFEDFQAGTALYWAGFDLVRQDALRMIVAGSEDALKPMDDAQKRSYTLSVTYGYLNIVLPTFAEARSEWLCLGYERAARMAISVLAYEQQHGQLPDHELVVNGVETVDPLWPDEGLILLVDGLGFRIYSRGSNGEDDRGLDAPRTGDLAIRIHR